MRTIRNYIALVFCGIPFSAVFASPEAGEAAAAGAGGPALAFVAIGIGVAIAAFGGALAQGRVASAFMEGVSRNPGADKVMRTPLILSLVFVETLVLFTVLIAFMLLGKF